ncbi:transcription elongation factor GreA [Candidatus Parcubacteria bacterium]|nr:MAG: transcription elongation factor GreA [Candidatus Parcubacteria bacterium]
MDTHYVSKERLRELKEELEQLRTKKRAEIAKRLKRAKEYGDLSENSEYTAAREEQTQVERRIAELKELLRNVTVVEKEKAASAQQEVTIGSVVTAQRGDEVVTYEIVGSNEIDPEAGKISHRSPIGKAFLGKVAGDTVLVKAPKGDIEYKILKVA